MLHFGGSYAYSGGVETEELVFEEHAKTEAEQTPFTAARAPHVLKEDDGEVSFHRKFHLQQPGPHKY